MAYFALGFLSGLIVATGIVAWTFRDIARLLNRALALADLRAEIEREARQP